MFTLAVVLAIPGMAFADLSHDGKSYSAKVHGSAVGTYKYAGKYPETLGNARFTLNGDGTGMFRVANCKEDSFNWGFEVNGAGEPVAYTATQPELQTGTCYMLLMVFAGEKEIACVDVKHGNALISTTL